jgi:hypothetical protein
MLDELVDLGLWGKGKRGGGGGVFQGGGFQEGMAEGGRDEGV